MSDANSQSSLLWASKPGIYLHIPFCRSKCFYCDFASQTNREQDFDAYVAAVEREIACYPVLDAATLYLGGGTPSLLPPALLDRLLRAVRSHFRLAAEAEVTMEINPGTGSEALWAVARAGGINRVSVGAQVFDDDSLTAIGRNHTVCDVYQTVAELRAAGFDNLSLDLMFGLPDQDLAAWHSSLEQALALAPEHFSIYSLQIEERTVFGRRQALGRLTLPGQDAERDLLDLVAEVLPRAGYDRYELSSWARPGFESVHNQIYWLTRPYIGLGVGAHSYFEGKRYAHGPSLDAYLCMSAPAIPVEPQSPREAMEEMLFLGLRLVRTGVSRAEFQRRFARDWSEDFGPAITKLRELNLIEETPESLRLTTRALPLANDVFCEFLP